MSLVVPVLISARDRPLYLWATLDNLYRNTRHPHQFTLLDMASTDPLVRDVIEGFERRGMFKDIIWSRHNDLTMIWTVTRQLIAGGGPYLAYVESDVVIEPSNPCWLERLVKLMEENPRLAMLGSAIDQDDFVDLESARRLEPLMPESQLRALIKADSPERVQDVRSANSTEIFQPHSPAGRVLLFRTQALCEIPWGPDVELHERFMEAGYQTGVASTVRHRHLSLLNIYDYPRYDLEARDRYFQGDRGNVSEPSDVPGSRQRST